MMTYAAKRYSLPFYERASNGTEIEAAAVFASAEMERGKGGGLIARQPQERIEFLTKIGYPLWVYPKNTKVFFFDGLGKSDATALYTELPSAKTFIDALEANSRPRENYLVFLINYASFFQQNLNEKKFTLEGLIAESGFREEFSVYRREATEIAGATLGVLLPSIDETGISANLTKLEKLQTTIREDAQRLPDCLRLVSRTTSQYVTEIDYESAAATEEANAKIKAQEQIVNPQIAQLNKNYNRKIKNEEENFNSELERLQKNKTRLIQFIKRNQEETKEYNCEAQAHAAKGHKVYERRWKEKIRKAKKELDNLKKGLKTIETNTKKITIQKKQTISQLISELDREVKLARQPLVQLEAEREAKIRFYKQETQKLLLQEKPVIESINKALRVHDQVAAKLEALGVREASLKEPALFYIPFYVTSYQGGEARRYRIIPPSKVANVDFSAKLRGALGISKTRALLAPRFKAISNRIESLEVYVKENAVFESQLWELGQRFNLLRNGDFQENAKRGLDFLRQADWLSEREQRELSSRFTG